MLTYPIENISSELKDDDELNSVMNFALENFGKWNAGQLTEWSHREGSPWDAATKVANFKWGEDISDALIFDYFQSLLIVSDGQDN